MSTGLCEQLIEQLRAEGHSKLADKLDFMTHKVAWTTGSEFEAAFKSEIQVFRQTGPAVSAKLQQMVDSYIG